MGKLLFNHYNPTLKNMLKPPTTISNLYQLIQPFMISEWQQLLPPGVPASDPPCHFCWGGLVHGLGRRRADPTTDLGAGTVIPDLPSRTNSKKGSIHITWRHDFASGTTYIYHLHVVAVLACHEAFLRRDFPDQKLAFPWFPHRTAWLSCSSGARSSNVNTDSPPSLFSGCIIIRWGTGYVKKIMGIVIDPLSCTCCGVHRVGVTVTPIWESLGHSPRPGSPGCSSDSWPQFDSEKIHSHHSPMNSNHWIMMVELMITSG